MITVYEKVTTLYLNNQGSRWILVNEKRQRINKVEFERDGSTHTRKAVHFGQWGNWGYAKVSYRGKLVMITDFKLLDN